MSYLTGLWPFAFSRSEGSLWFLQEAKGSQLDGAYAQWWELTNHLGGIFFWGHHFRTGFFFISETWWSSQKISWSCCFVFRFASHVFFCGLETWQNLETKVGTFLCKRRQQKKGTAVGAWNPPRKLVEITLKSSSLILSLLNLGGNWHDKSPLVESIWWKFVDPLDLLDRNVRIGSFGRKIPSSNPWATTQSECQGKKLRGMSWQWDLYIYIYVYIYHDTNLIYLFMWFWYAYILWLYICARTYIYTHKDWSFPYDIAWHTT